MIQVNFTQKIQKVSAWNLNNKKRQLEFQAGVFFNL